MWFPTWPRSRDARPAIERLHAPRSPHRRPRFRPGTEVLDERCLLSTLVVTSSMDGTGFVGRGVSDGTLRGEIAVAKSGDTIVFAPSLDGKTITLGYGSYHDQLEINKNLTIQGPGAGLLAIYGRNMSRVFQVDAGANVTISGLKIGGGDGVASYYTGNAGWPTSASYDGCGGGILNLGTLALSGCTVAANDTNPHAGYGGGVHGFIGGGIGNFGTMTLSGSTVTGNSAPAWGGGIYNDGTMTLGGSTVTYNTAYTGGGIFNDPQGHLTALSSVVQNNTAAYGAGIDNVGWMQISGNTVTGNSASSCGGGIYNDGTMTLSGSTVTGNSARSGGGIFNDTEGELTILSSVVQGNTAQDGADICSLGSLTISTDSKVGKISHK